MGNVLCAEQDSYSRSAVQGRNQGRSSRVSQISQRNRSNINWLDQNSETGQKSQKEFIKNWLTNSTLKRGNRNYELSLMFNGEIKPGDTFNAIRYRNGDFYYGQVKLMAPTGIANADSKGPPKKLFGKHGFGRLIKFKHSEQIAMMDTSDDQWDKYEYIGQFKNDKRSGLMGKCFFHNGDFYAGSWKNDRMDTTVSQQSFELQNPSQDAVLIQQDGLYRYFGQFKENKKNGHGVEYQEYASDREFQIHIFRGQFKSGKKTGEGELQVFRHQNSFLTVIDLYLILYKDGEVIKQTKLGQQNQINFPSVQKFVIEDRNNAGLKTTDKTQKAMDRAGNQSVQLNKLTCLEELDSLTKINELVNKYPRIDKEWLPDKQVSQWLFAIQIPQEIIDLFIKNQIDGSALLELNQSDLEDLMGLCQKGESSPDDTDTASPGGAEKSVQQLDKNVKIVKILTQIEKLRIIWYKTLKKLKLVDEYQETLREFGIIGDQTSAIEADSQNYETNIQAKEPQTPEEFENTELKQSNSQVTFNGKQKNTFFKNKLVSQVANQNYYELSGALSDQNFGWASKSVHKDQDDMNNSLMNLDQKLSSFNLKKSDSIGPNPNSKDNDLASDVKFEINFEEEVQQLISTLEQQDFLIPIEQIEILNSDENEVKDYLQDKDIIAGKWFKGLLVNLNERQIHNQFQIQQLVEEVNIIKNIRHPNIEMHLGVSFKKEIKQVEAPREMVPRQEVAYKFYMITKNIENQSSKEDSPYQQSPLRSNSSCTLEQYMHDLRQSILLDKDNLLNHQSTAKSSIDSHYKERNIFSKQLNNSHQQQYKNSLRNYNELYQITKQIVSILKYLHKKGMAHGSLCASNVILERKMYSKGNLSQTNQSLDVQLGGDSSNDASIESQISIQLRDFSQAYKEVQNPLQNFEKISISDSAPSKVQEMLYQDHQSGTFVNGAINQTISQQQDQNFEAAQRKICIQSSYEQLNRTAHMYSQLKQSKVPLYYRPPEMMVHFNFMMYENIEMPFQKYNTPVDIEYTQGTDDDMGGHAYNYNKKSQMTVNAPNPIEINFEDTEQKIFKSKPRNMFTQSHSINNDSFGISQGNDQNVINADIDNRIETDCNEESGYIGDMDNYRKLPGRKLLRNPKTIQGGFRSYVSPQGNRNAPSFGSLPHNQSFNFADVPNHFKSQSYDNLGDKYIQVHYQYPERNQYQSIAQDIFSLGVLILELISANHVQSPDELQNAQNLADQNGGKNNRSTNMWNRLFDKKSQQGGSQKGNDEPFGSDKSRRSSIFSFNMCATQIEGLQKFPIKSAVLPLHKHLLPGSFNRNRSNAQIIGMQGYYHLMRRNFQEQQKLYHQIQIEESKAGSHQKGTRSQMLSNSFDDFGIQSHLRSPNGEPLSSGTCSQDEEFLDQNLSHKSKQDTKKTSTKSQFSFIQKINKKLKEQKKGGASVNNSSGVFLGSSLNLQDLNITQKSYQKHLQKDDVQSQQNKSTFLDNNNFNMQNQNQVQFADFMKVDNIYAQVLIDIAQKCMHYEQDDRPAAYALWKELEKFEKAVQAWNHYYQNQQPAHGQPPFHM